MKNNLPVTCLRPAHGRPLRTAAFARRFASWLAFAIALASGLSPALGQTPAATGSVPASPPNAVTPAAPASPTSTLEQFGWLHGCWDGKSNQRDFREEWGPPRGDMMIGVSQTVSQGKTQNFEYLRLESRPEGIFYVNVASGKTEASFRFAGKTLDNDREVFTFENPVDAFPQRLIYRRGAEGWLYAQVDGKVNGEPRSVTYPMRRIDCASGEILRQ